MAGLVLSMLEFWVVLPRVLEAGTHELNHFTIQQYFSIADQMKMSKNGLINIQYIFPAIK
jgi:hypothetical protein